ncbi:GPP34 family phosphoprotein [Brachybacterium horti]
MTTIPGELFLLLTDEAGRQRSTTYRRQALIAGALSELVLRERIALTPGRGPRVEVQDPAPTGVPELDHVLAGLEDRRRPRAVNLLRESGLDVTRIVGDAFVAAGEVERVKGWFTTSWPAVPSRGDGGPRTEETLRARLAQVLQGHQRASLQDAVVLEILLALRNAHRILRAESGGLSHRAMERRVRELGVDVPAARALRDMITAMNVALSTSTSGTMAQS